MNSHQNDVINEICNRISEAVTLLIRGRCSKLGQTACPDDDKIRIPGATVRESHQPENSLYAIVAQLVEQKTFNFRAVDSNSAGRTNNINDKKVNRNE